MTNLLLRRARTALKPHLVPAKRAFAVGAPVVALGTLALSTAQARAPLGPALRASLELLVLALAVSAAAAASRHGGAAAAFRHAPPIRALVYAVSVGTATFAAGRWYDGKLSDRAALAVLVLVFATAGPLLYLLRPDGAKSAPRGGSP